MEYPNPGVRIVSFGVQGRFSGAQMSFQPRWRRPGHPEENGTGPISALSQVGRGVSCSLCEIVCNRHRCGLPALHVLRPTVQTFGGGRLRVRYDAQENSCTAKPGIRPDNDCVPGTYAYGHAAAQVGGEVAERIFP